MPKQKSQETGPSTFFEWVVGTTVQSATRPSRSKFTRRDMIRIELSTDDEDETDSLRVTYPRSGRTTATNARATKNGSKKVRFESVPHKSAMKRATTTVTEVETDEESTDVETSENEKPVRKTKAKKGKKGEESSEDESEPHAPCRCIDCIRARQKAKKHSSTQKGSKKTAFESGDSDSDSETSSTKDKEGKKKYKKAEVESELEDTDSEPADKKGNKKNQKQRGGKKNNNNETTEESSTEEEKPSKKNDKQQKNEANSSKKREQQKQKDDKKKGSYPEGLPEPHPRRPNYIEPIRAEVVQTERVLEGPEDPKPNAYYDAEHNIIRVYHGPVYGQNHGQGLYPKRDPNNRPLPMGTPHPSQNPWFNGFKDGQGETNVPITQGMPTNSIYLPHMYPPGGPYGFPPPMDGGWNRGAFAQMGGANGQGENKSASNNVGPGSVKAPSLEGKDNPYYQHATGHGKRSQFSGWGSNKDSPKNDKWSSTGPNNNDGARDSNGKCNDNNSWNAPNNGNSAGSNGNQGSQDGGAASWDNTPHEPAADAWDNGNQTSTTNDWSSGNQTSTANEWGGGNQASNTDNWGAPQSSPPKPNVGEENNVAPVETMPGSWDSTPAWGDSSAAAATGGALDDVVDDGLPGVVW